MSRRLLAVAAALLLLSATPTHASAAVRLIKLSSDPFTNSTSQHKTEVEPDIFSYGSTEVAVFQTGRFYDGGSSDTGWATSTNAGKTWSHGFLPGITTIEGPSGQYAHVSDPAVAYDAFHSTWLVSGLPLINVSSGAIGQMPTISSSTDGLHWNNPVIVAPNNGDFIDKEWIACDNWSKSKYLGHCYVEFDDAYQGDAEEMTTSKDGGKTWSTPQVIGVYGLGGQPLVLPSGTVVVPYEDAYGNISSFTSTNGGASWGGETTIAAINFHGVAGNLRTSPLPSAQIDGGGKIYVVWEDCSFRTNCSSNDIVMSTTTDGAQWSGVARVPIDATSSTVDHFIPGIAADINTSGSGAHLGLTYYFYPKANCSPSTCQLTVGFIGSQDGGTTWGTPTTLTAPMNLQWLAQTNQGYMVGDYIATAFAGGLAHAAFSVAVAPKASNSFVQHMATTKDGLSPLEGFMRRSSRGDRRMLGTRYARPRFWLPPLNDPEALTTTSSTE